VVFKSEERKRGENISGKRRIGKCDQKKRRKEKRSTTAHGKGGDQSGKDGNIHSSYRGGRKEGI